MINYNYIIRITLLYSFICSLIRLVTDNIKFHIIMQYMLEYYHYFLLILIHLSIITFMQF